MIYTLKRKARYYETDQMGIVHHSNYIRWFEEARTEYLEEIGLPYEKIEQEGLLIPVLSCSCVYKSPVKFDEEINVSITETSFNGLKFTVKYEVTSATDNSLKTTGESSHCFLDSKFNPILIKKTKPDFYRMFTETFGR